jgi:hypothetical protein
MDLFYLISCRSDWANTYEKNGSGCVLELDIHIGLQYLYEHVYITWYVGPNRI